ncbi:hypothetical protein RUND412_001369 [Rhizina undulata]
MEQLINTLANLATGKAINESTAYSSSSKKMSKYTPIPMPPGLPLLGNLQDIDPELPLRTFEHLAEIYGPIYAMDFGGIRKTIISSHEFMDEICNEERFSKAVQGSLAEVRNGVKDGLFTAHFGERNWGIAHRILMPAFGPLSVRGMFDEMHDIASQLVLKWARYGTTYKIPVAEDFTRLTLDTIALCAMDYRFNSYYQEKMHPFVDAMVGFLIESGRRANRPTIANLFMRGSQQQYDADIAELRQVSDELIQHRRAHPSDRKDLLNAMINGRDPKTGEGLSDDTISYNMITFLIAGHETTSGLLSFVFLNLLQNPSAYRAAQKEVDTVIGKGRITVDDLPKLKYINALLRETLRLTPTAPVFTLRPRPDTKEDPVTLGGGKYVVGKDEPLIAILTKIHRDPKVWGEDAEEFKPERMLDEKFDKLPKNAWKPFGNGVRGCIGRPFAWQEALLVTALLLQNFSFHMHDPNYKSAIKQTLTIKPKDFYMHATLRDGIDTATIERNLVGGSVPKVTGEASVKKNEEVGVKKPLSIFYGSNTGTCEALAQRLAIDAAGRGFAASVDTLDSAIEGLPKDQPVVIITASYEGEPPDNAAHFVEWLKALSGKELQETQYAVFGCGHHDWTSTFQRIPTLVDDLIAERGGKRLTSRGSADAANGDMYTEFDTWEDSCLWPSITSAFGGSEPSLAADVPGISVQISSQKRSSSLRADVKEGLVVKNKLLTARGEPEKRHIEIKLPSDMPYRAGDYLAVLPTNPKENVRRAMRRFNLPWDAVLKISASTPTTLPTDTGISASDVLSAYVELAQPATKRNILTLAAVAVDEKIKAELEALADEKYQEEISLKKTSPLDLLEKYSTLPLPFATFLSLLPPMRVRQYSISSSPLCDPSNCTLTYSVLDQEAFSGQGRHVGVASNYLSMLEPGDRIQVSVRPSSHAFHLPRVATTPVIMICAGTGLAPFRGFIQERAAQIAAGRTMARALLFIGCRSSTSDRLYTPELENWTKLGAVEIRYAFSRETENSEGCKYVQDRLWYDRDEASSLFDQGAKVFVCGSAVVGEAVGSTCKKIYAEKAAERGFEKTEEQVKEWFWKMKNERFATDVFA